MLNVVEYIKNNIKIFSHKMRTLNGIGVIVGVTSIALAGIVLVVAASVLLPVNATDVMTSTTGGGGEAPSTTSTNNNSNAVLGSLFFIGEGIEASVNPINETYSEVSFEGNVTLIPPNNNTRINTTMIGNGTLNILPNGLGFGQGQSVLVTEGGDGTAEQENATTSFVDISRTNPDGTVSGIQLVFFSTNSTGQLAFLNNMVGISQVEFTADLKGGTIRMWEWKGGTVPFSNGSGSEAATTENQTTSMN
jgi:hypothetical protein